MKKILFVCTGNICRSPTAEAIARHKAKQLGLSEKFVFDSAGTDGFHVGELPDKRSVKTGEERGISFAGISARKISAEDFEKFDFLMCMDRSHYAKLLRMAPEKYQNKVQLFLQFCEAENKWDDEVIDPYYKSSGAFDEVFDVIDLALENMFIPHPNPLPQGERELNRV